MIIDPFSLGLAAIQGGLSLFGGASQQNEAIYQSNYDRTYRNLMIGYENEQTRRAYTTQIGQAREQIGLNRDAANRAYISEQRRLDEIFSSAAMENQGLIDSLAQVQGTNNATERYGKSADRIRNIEGLGNFGRQQATLVDNLTRAVGQSRYNMDEIYRQNEVADRNTWLPLSVPPTTQAGLPPVRSSGGGALNTALMIGNAALSGFNTYQSLKPPSGWSGSNFGGGSFSGSYKLPTSLNTFNPSQAYSMPKIY